jgi:signal peptidase I
MRSNSTARLAGSIVLVAGALTWISSPTSLPQQAEPMSEPEQGLQPERPALTLAPPLQIEPAAEESRSTAKRVINALGMLLTVAAVVLWALFLRPASLGGPASYVLVSGKSMLPRYHTGDLVLVERQSSYRIGEVIAYRVPKGDAMAGAQVIHRIIGGNATQGFIVQGDNRTAPDVWRPKATDIVGAKALRMPNAVFVLQFLRSPLLLGLFAACFVFVRVFTREKDEPELPKTVGVLA